MASPPSIPGQAASGDDTRWFAEHVQPHERELRAYLHRRFPKVRDIDDVVQESYLKLLRVRGANGILSVKHYLFSIARNAALALFRPMRATREVSVGDPAVFGHLDEQDLAAGAEQRSELAQAIEAIGSLPPRCREILVLYFIHGLSQPEIAAHLGLSINTVRNHLANGLDRCIDTLRARGVLEEAK